MTGPVEIGWVDLLLAASLLLAHGLVSLWLDLGLGRRVLVAALRTTVQLGLLGLVLVPVFSTSHPALVLGIAALMLALAAREATARGERRTRGMLLHSLLAITLGAVASLALGQLGVLRVQPWWSPQYLVPLLGMILGNSLNGIGLGFERALQGLDQGREQVELRLARGATWWEACRPIAREAIKTGLVPILNSMSVAGLVSIPGMMTGQILGGTPPGLAARYQVLIMFLIAGAVAIGTTTGVLLTLRSTFDGAWRLRSERILRR
ncbi:iron export ABC transporter permease subunit FetB [Myxococcota bacterium]|nr:iron export ABC transporter permease subunit FetB [Myxococcota bacterium]